MSALATVLCPACDHPGDGDVHAPECSVSRRVTMLPDERKAMDDAIDAEIADLKAAAAKRYDSRCPNCGCSGLHYCTGKPARGLTEWRRAPQGCAICNAALLPGEGKLCPACKEEDPS